MIFTQPCFIRKNTPELIKKLEELGYKYSTVGGIKSNNIVVSRDCIFDIYPIDTIKRGFNNCIDCGENEELFLALAALRDDSDYMQWFVNKNGYFEMCFNNKVENYLCGNGIRKYRQIDETYHKATVEEIIQHFK